MANNQKKLKAFVRYDGSGRVVASSLILRKNKPRVGRWFEIPTYDCCNDTTSSTTTVAPTTTTTSTTSGLFSGNVNFHPDAAGACSGIGASIIAVTGNAATFCDSTELSGAGIATGLPIGMTFRASVSGSNQVYNVVRNGGSTVTITSACTSCP